MTDQEWGELSLKNGVPEGVGPMVLKAVSCWYYLA